jgi:hypothetical protein
MLIPAADRDIGASGCEIASDRTKRHDDRRDGKLVSFVVK